MQSTSLKQTQSTSFRQKPVIAKTRGKQKENCNNKKKSLTDKEVGDDDVDEREENLYR